MSADKTLRIKRRRNNALTIVRQLRICRYYDAKVGDPHGAFRKRHALNCGRSHCMMCVNPRRTWGRKTLAEISSARAFQYELYCQHEHS